MDVRDERGDERRQSELQVCRRRRIDQNSGGLTAGTRRATLRVWMQGPAVSGLAWRGLLDW